MCVLEEFNMPTFPYGDSDADREALLGLLRRIAKKIKPSQPAAQLSAIQDKMAAAFGYGNWSMLHKHVLSASPPEFWKFATEVNSHAKIGPLLEALAPPLDEKFAAEQMEAWVRRTYTPLIEFAYYDRESPTGYSWPDEDLIDGLQVEFGHSYPQELIEQVAYRLEGNEGPWGIERY
jgi:hypothetical protein